MRCTGDPAWHLDPVALFGAVLAVVTFLWNASREWRDRAHVKLRLYIAHMHPLGSNGPPEATMLAGSVVSLGRRPIYVTGVAAENRKGRRCVIVADPRIPNPDYDMPPLPFELKQYQTMRFRLPLQQLADADSVRFLVEDTTGRTWRLPKKAFRKVHQDVLRILAGHAAGKSTD